ncbi:hypothetical protein [Chitinophaga filiformis]|uniref:Uncharacterized protein n=1 Tax=Chitinophaga filiformis TaxID=104663 RepID=A0A1G7XQU6_CHIFI|nr:hypothetical protein [Chitinophaga filiformis]SDG86476.1 hypothetical protein SAMN04488121_10738 [Chitinophaga filiformis]
MIIPWKNSILFATLILFSSFSSPGKDKRCDSCTYEGRITRVKFDERYGKYVSIRFAPCDIVPWIEKAHCETVDNCFYLKGWIHQLSNPQATDLKILKAVKDKDGGYTVTDTLGKVGNDWQFSFKVCNRKYNDFLFIELHDGIYLNYEMRGFKASGDSTAKSIMGMEMPAEWLKLNNTYKKLETHNIVQ